MIAGDRRERAALWSSTDERSHTCSAQGARGDLRPACTPTDGSLHADGGHDLKIVELGLAKQLPVARGGPWPQLRQPSGTRYQLRQPVAHTVCGIDART